MKHKIFIPALDGFGDMLIANNAGYFGRRIGKNILGKLHTAYRNGLIEDIRVIVSPCYTYSAMKEVWDNVSIPIQCTPIEDMFPSYTNSCKLCNNLPSISENGYYNARTNLPPEIANLPVTPVNFPFKKPEGIELPERYIFFTAEAGVPERFLRDQSIIKAIRTATPRPIVQCGAQITRAGESLSPIDVKEYEPSIDLRPTQSILEMLWIAKNSVLIVSPVTSLRSMSVMCNVPVIELIDYTEYKSIDVSKQIMDNHYSDDTYGLKNKDNHWFSWPNQSEDFMNKIRDLVEKRGGHW